MKAVRVEFDMTSESLVTATADRADSDPNSRKDRRKMQRVFGGVLLLLSAVLAFDVTCRTPTVITASMGCVAGAVVGLALRFPTRRAWRQSVCNQVAAVLTTPGGKATLGPRSVEVGDDGIAIASALARTVVTWRGVIDVIPTADHLVVILPGPVHLCVPRQAFDSDHDFERFSETVNALAATGGGLSGRIRTT